MGTQNPGKLNIKALQMKFDFKPSEPPPVISYKKSPIAKQDRPMFITKRRTIKPPSPQPAQLTHPPTLAEPTTPDVASLPPTVTEIQNEPQGTLNSVDRELNMSKASLEKGGEKASTLLPNQAAPETLAPSPTEAASQTSETSVSYKGHLLPETVQIDGATYKLTPLSDSGVAPPSPHRPAEVEIVVPNDADEDEMGIYDNNVNLMKSLNTNEEVEDYDDIQPDNPLERNSREPTYYGT